MKPNRKTVISIAAFTVLVLILTRLDVLINHRFYFHGLQYSDSWYSEYTVLYNLLYHVPIAILLLYSKSWKLTLMFEAFTLTATQDIIYFALWIGNFPSCQWTWMMPYKLFGYWDTTTQILLSLSVNVLIASLIMFSSLQRSNQK